MQMLKGFLSLTIAFAPLSAAPAAVAEAGKAKPGHQCNKSVCKIPASHWAKLKAKRRAAAKRKALERPLAENGEKKK